MILEKVGRKKIKDLRTREKGTSSELEKGAAELLFIYHLRQSPFTVFFFFMSGPWAKSRKTERRRRSGSTHHLQGRARGLWRRFLFFVEARFFVFLQARWRLKEEIRNCKDRLSWCINSSHKLPSISDLTGRREGLRTEPTIISISKDSEERRARDRHCSALFSLCCLLYRLVIFLWFLLCHWIWIFMLLRWFWIAS